MLTGAVSGGITAKIVGGDFTKGMFNGAWTAGFATIFNDSLNGAANFVSRMTAGDTGGKASFYDNQTEGSVTDAAKTGLFLLGGFAASASALVAGDALVAYGGALCLDAYPYIMSAAGTELGQMFLNGLPDYLSAALPGTAPNPNIPGFFGWATAYYLNY